MLETCISVRLALHSTGIIFLFIPTGKKGREITESREFHTALTEYVCVCVTGVISHRCTVFSGFMIRVFVCVCVCVSLRASLQLNGSLSSLSLDYNKHTNS